VISHPDIESFISRFEERAAPIEQAADEARWALATTGTEEAKEELVRTGMEYNRLFADGDEYERVKGFYEKRDTLGPLLGRQVEVLYRTFAGRQGDEATLERIQKLEAEANAVHSNYRGVVGGTEVGENEIREILRASDDGALRREAWEASKTIGRELEDTVRELARLRNRLAREAGYLDHYRRSLDLQELDVAQLTRIMDELEAATDVPFRGLREELDAELTARFATAAVMPWHLPDPFFQSCRQDVAARGRPGGVSGAARSGPGSDRDPGASVASTLDVDRYFRDKNLEDLTRKTYDNMGLEVRDVLARSDLYERSGKSQHAFCLALGRDYPYDVRVLANVRPDSYWMETMLHEFGHAVYDKHINPELPYFLRTVAHTSTTEAIALMMGSLAEDPTWISAVAGVPEAELEEVREQLLWQDRTDRLVFTRWALVMFNFEKALYENPDREDLNDLWWDLVGRLQLVNRPPGRDEPDWAAKIHVAVAPVYYHNYVLGHLTATQLRHYLEERVSGGPFFTSEVAGRYLLEAVFGPGARNNWEDTVLRATGERLNPVYFVNSLH
jgi:peptidyl-dipeptidase A